MRSSPPSHRLFDSDTAIAALLKCPYPIYTDPTPQNDLYTSLSLTHRTTSPGPSSQKGDYLANVSMTDAILKGTLNGIKMPLFVSPGDMKLLGGEFVFEPVRTRSIRRKPPKAALAIHTSVVPLSPSKLNRPLPVPPKSPRRPSVNGVAARVTSTYPVLKMTELEPSPPPQYKADDKPIRRSSTSLPAFPAVPTLVDTKSRRDSAPAGLHRLASLSRRGSRRVSRDTTASTSDEAEDDAPMVPGEGKGTVQIKCRYAHRMSSVPLFLLSVARPVSQLTTISPW